MPKRKSILKRVHVEIAERRRTCKFSGEKFTKGESCVVVYDAPREYKGYSRSVALQMIEDARKRLDELEDELS